MSVSSTSERTWTVSRLAIFNNTVPPPTLLVADEMTVPTSTFRSITTPLMGDRTSVSSNAILASSSDRCARTCCAFALAAASLAVSYSCSVMDCVLYSSSERRSCDCAFASCALATSRSAWAWTSALFGTRGSTWTRRWPTRTTSPVSTATSRISPEALDFTSTVMMGSTAPAALAETTMSRVVTGTS